MDIQIFNLGPNVTNANLLKIFGAHGVVNSAEVARNQLNGRSNGKAVVVMPVEAHARQAIEALNKTLLDGKMMSVAELKL
jgi:RNA recognition motif-containing protein